jgi:non-ribosomal peptide synthetase component F
VLEKFQVCLFNSADVNSDTVMAANTCEWRMFVEHVPDAKRLLPLRLRVVFNTMIYARERMGLMLRQLQSVLEQLCTKPELAVGHVSCVTDHGKAHLPDPAAPLDRTWEGAIFEKLSAQAAVHPDRVLIHEAGGVTWTYKQVDELSNRLANHLVGSGVKPEDRVAMYAHRSAALVVGIMGILKSGATFTVIDPAYPVARQIVYLKVAQPTGILTLAAAGVPAAEVQTYIDSSLQVCCQFDGLCMEATGALVEASAGAVGVTVGPDSIGTLSFTSGERALVSPPNY